MLLRDTLMASAKAQDIMEAFGSDLSYENQYEFITSLLSRVDNDGLVEIMGEIENELNWRAESEEQMRARSKEK